MKLELDEEQNSESHVQKGGLSSGAEGSEATEIDQVDLFDDHGLTVSSLVSIDCNEDRGNGPASLDKSFGEDKYVAKEVVGGMMHNLSIDATDGSDVGENVFSEQKFSNMQLIGQEDVLEEDAFVSGVGGLALNNPLCGGETKSMAKEFDQVHGSLHYCNVMVQCVGEYGEQQNFSQASTLKHAINDDCAAYHGTMDYVALQHSFDFSISDINLFLGDEVMKSTSEISETNFTCEDNPVASVTKENEPNFSFVSDESIYESDEVLMKEKDVAKKSSDCRYSENELVEVEKSSICIDEPADSVDMRLEDDFKSSGGEGSITKMLLGGHRREERVREATELRENVLKSNSMMEDQSSQFTELAVEGGTAAAEDAAEMWRPNSESVEAKNSLTKLNSTTIRRKNEQSSLIQKTPKKQMTLDMKETAPPSIKTEHLGSTAVRSTRRRRALGCNS
ncbi:hypothetical protein ACSBR1_001069 [Camellia fascicularis]